MALNTGNPQKTLQPRRNTQLAMMTVIREIRTRKPHMVDYDDEEREGPVVVRRPVYEAGMKLEAAAKTGDPAFETARDKAAELRAAGKTDDAAFWDEIFQFLMTRESVGAEAETIILEQGETYDWDEGEVIRHGSDQRRSDRGC